MLEMNIKDILQEMGLMEIEVDHSDLSSASPDQADLFVVAKDIAEGAAHLRDIVVLESIIDTNPLDQETLSSNPNDPPRSPLTPFPAKYL